MNTRDMRDMRDDSPRQAGRRSFISAMGILTGVAALGGPLAAFLPSRSWAMPLRVLSTPEAATLMAMIRTIAPHDGLEDAAYALVVAALDADAAASAEARSALTDGVTSLGEGFALRPESQRVERLTQIESGAFFQSVRVKTLLVLYDNPIAWTHFGYEGEAFSKGGYLLRGFDDLMWLPAVPLIDSGTLPLG